MLTPAILPVSAIPHVPLRRCGLPMTRVLSSRQIDLWVGVQFDRLDVNRETFLAGEAPSVPLVEIREG